MVTLAELLRAVIPNITDEEIAAVRNHFLAQAAVICDAVMRGAGLQVGDEVQIGNGDQHGIEED
jgi:hypothetical protein